MTTMTVALLCMDQARYLAQCIDSLAAQTSEDFEVLFLDNCSSDESFEEAERRLSRSGLRYRAVRNAKRRGISANLNSMLAQCETELFAPLAADDWFEPGYVDAMIAAAAENPQAGWFSCLGWLEFEDIGTRTLVKRDSAVAGKGVRQAIVDGDTPFFFVGCCYRAAALRAVDGWDENMPIEDRDLFYRLSADVEHVALAVPLAHYRRHSSSASADAAFMQSGWEAFFAKHATDFGPALRVRKAAMYRQTAALLIDQRRHDVAKSPLRKAFRLAPVDPALWRTVFYYLRTIGQW